MDPAYLNKKIVDLSDAELITLGFLGENVAPDVKSIVDAVKANPDRLGTVTCFMVDCLKSMYPQDATQPPASPTLSEAETLYSELNNDSDARTVVAPDLISKYEMNFWYHGVSGNPPKLMWRSDLETNPFPIPPPGTNFFKIPTKAARGVFKTPLNDVWDDVAPRILASMKAHGLKYSALQTARFSTVEDGKNESLGPVVVWIAVRPNTTNAGAVRDATPGILHILADVRITDVVVTFLLQRNRWLAVSAHPVCDSPTAKFLRCAFVFGQSGILRFSNPLFSSFNGQLLSLHPGLITLMD